VDNVNNNLIGDNQGNTPQTPNDLNTPITPAQGGDYNSAQPTPSQFLSSDTPVNGGSTSPSVADFSSTPSQKDSSTPTVPPFDFSQQATDLSQEPSTMGKETVTGDQVSTPPITPMDAIQTPAQDSTPVQPVSGQAVKTETPESTPVQQPAFGQQESPVSTDATTAQPTFGQEVQAQTPKITPVQQPEVKQSVQPESTPQVESFTPTSPVMEQAPTMEVNTPKNVSDSSIGMQLPSEQSAQESVSVPQREDIVNNFEEGSQSGKSKKGGTAVLIVLITVIVALLATIGYFAYKLFLS